MLYNNIFKNTELLNFPPFLCEYHIYYDLKMKVFPWSMNIFWDLVNTVLLNWGYFYFFYVGMKIFGTFSHISTEIFSFTKKKKQIIIYSRMQHFGSFYRNNSGTLICWRGVCVCVALPTPALTTALHLEAFQKQIISDKHQMLLHQMLLSFFLWKWKKYYSNNCTHCILFISLIQTFFLLWSLFKMC